MLVEDPVFSGDKEKAFLIPSSIQRPVPLQRDIFTLLAPQYIET